LEARIRKAGGGKDLVAGGEAARIIVYCQTIELMQELASEMNCSMYTGDHETMSGDEKDAAIEQWLGPTGSSVIVATSAPGVSFEGDRLTEQLPTEVSNGDIHYDGKSMAVCNEIDTVV
jgi:hypothetical protein